MAQHEHTLKCIAKDTSGGMNVPRFGGSCPSAGDYVPFELRGELRRAAGRKGAATRKAKVSQPCRSRHVVGRRTQSLVQCQKFLKPDGSPHDGEHNYRDSSGEASWKTEYLDGQLVSIEHVDYGPDSSPFPSWLRTCTVIIEDGPNQGRILHSILPKQLSTKRA